MSLEDAVNASCAVPCVYPPIPIGGRTYVDGGARSGANADLAAGFITVQNRLSGEGLEEYIRPVGGGYFFALPGVAGPESFLGEGLLAAV